MNDVFFFVPGEVVGKGRPKFSTQGHFVKAYTPAKTTNYENLVKLSYQAENGEFRFPDDAQLVMEIVAVFPIPKSVSKKKAALMMGQEILPAKKPDCDNIVKAICDALNLVAYKDDSQIVELNIVKRYECDSWQLGAYVTIRERE